jgi:hypothetical protein
MIVRISIGFIITIIIIQVYFILNPQNDENFTPVDETNKIKDTIIEFIDPNPWSKVVTTPEGKKYFYTKLNKFNEKLYMEWKEIIENLDYDISTKELIIESRDEPRALAILNLIISNMKGNITISEIFENDLMNKSIIKARKHKVVSKKLLELIKENNEQFTGIVNNEDTYSQDTFKHENIPSKNTSQENLPYNVSPQSTILDEGIVNKISVEESKDRHKILKPEDYNYDGFENNHNNVFSEDKLVRNKLNAEPYGGKMYASPFSY